MTDLLPESLFDSLAAAASKWQTIGDWPLSSLQLCGQQGVFAILAGATGDGATVAAVGPTEPLELLIRLAKADLLTTFVITQHMGAIKRLLASDPSQQKSDRNEFDHSSLLSQLIRGEQFASVGISHLTTSRLHLGRPAVSATRQGNGYRLRGTIPWVTGAAKVQQIVVGATLDDRRQILALVPSDAVGVQPGPGAEMIAMSASCTDAVQINDLLIPDSQVLVGPCENVLTATSSITAPSGAGGLQTSALALGVSLAALDYLRGEALKRDHLRPIVEQFERDHQSLREMIFDAALGKVNRDSGEIRVTANTLVQRTTSAAMTTAKGAGMMAEHPVGRWCCQALFFLVWSCPQSVAEAHLCELAGLDS